MANLSTKLIGLQLFLDKYQIQWWKIMFIAFLTLFFISGYPYTALPLCILAYVFHGWWVVYMHSLRLTNYQTWLSFICNVSPVQITCCCWRKVCWLKYSCVPQGSIVGSYNSQGQSITKIWLSDGAPSGSMNVKFKVRIDWHWVIAVKIAKIVQNSLEFHYLSYIFFMKTQTEEMLWLEQSGFGFLWDFFWKSKWKQKISL